MIWKRYQNELIVAGALILALFALGYKSMQHASVVMENQRMAQEVVALEEITSLQKIWGDKHISPKLEAVKKMIPPSKMKWNKEGNKVTVSLHELLPSEVNRIVTKLLNVPVQIRHLKVEKKNSTYEMEFSCKW
jgi:hypothetical protein